MRALDGNHSVEQRDRALDPGDQFFVGKPREIIERGGNLGSVGDLIFDLDARAERRVTILNGSESAQFREPVSPAWMSSR